MSLKIINMLLLLFIIFISLANSSAGDGNNSNAILGLNLSISNESGIISNHSTIYPEDKLTIELFDEDGKSVSGDIYFNLEKVGEIKPPGLLKKSIEPFTKTIEDEKKDTTLLISGYNPTNGQYTLNNITITIETNYESIQFRDLQLLISKNNPNKILLENELNRFDEKSTELNYSIQNFDYSSDATYFKYNDVSDSYNKINQILSEKEVKEQANDGEIKAIEDRIFKIDEEMRKRMDYIADNIKKAEVEELQAEVYDLNSNFTATKADLRGKVIYPWGIISIFLGVIVGYLIVQRWKEKAISIGFQSKKAMVTSPIKISVAISIILIVIMLIILIVNEDLNLLKYLI